VEPSPGARSAGSAGCGRCGAGAVDRLTARVDDAGAIDDLAVGADPAVDRLGQPVAGPDLVVAGRDHVALGAVADELVDAAVVEHVGAEAALEVVVAFAALVRMDAEVAGWPSAFASVAG
jgi:hypothetical protein